MNKIIILLTFCVCLSTYSQNYKFGKVSKEELEEKFNPADSVANATYLFKDRNTYFSYINNQGFQLITEIHERIKIYNKEGFGYATKSISLYKNGGSEEKVNGLKAYTFNLEKGKVIETKLGKGSIFETEKSKYRNETKLTMPNIKPGSVIEYKYKVISPFISNVNDFVFQYNIPVKILNAKFTAPEYFVFKINTKGFLQIKPIIENKRGKIIFNNKSRSSSGTMGSGVSTSYDPQAIDYNEKSSLYSFTDIPALQEEPYVNNLNNYRSTVNYELSYTDFPNSPIEPYSTTWEDVVKSIYKSDNFGLQIEKSGYYDDEIDALIGGVSDPKKRATLIFEYVKTHVKWNDYHGYLSDEGVRKAFKEKTGNVAEINLMLTSMLRYAGLRAYPVLVSTRANGIPLFPTREGYNYVVSYVKFAEGDDMLLDATNKYTAPNILPFKALNWKGRVITEKGNSKFIDLYPKTMSKITTTMLVNLDDQGTIKGNYRNLKTAHSALSFRGRYNGVDKDDYLEKLENKYNGLEISDFNVKNNMDIYKPTMESYKFEKEAQADIIGEKIYFSPLFFLKENQNPFKLEKREFPVDFGYPSATKYRVIVNIPEGYKIESLPKPIVIALPDNLMVFKYNISGQGKTVKLTIESQIKQSIVTPLYYDALKAYFSQLVDKEAEQIVLTKV